MKCRYLKNQIKNFYEYKFDDKDFKFPVMKIYRTFENDVFLFGEEAIFKYLQENRFLNIDMIRRDAWAEAGIKFINEEFRKVLDFLYLNPRVSWEVNQRALFQIHNPWKQR